MKIIARGFTLIEVVATMLLLSVGAAGIIGMYGTVGRTLSGNQDMQTAVQLAQECSEYILAARRNNTAVDYAGVTGLTFCSAALPAMTGFTVTTTITSPYAPTFCPGTCKLVTIAVLKGANALATSSLMLVDY
ncbi:MAG: prepilin-type N-terminal cleavage/methylation domain-containing protein [Gammaproteobacteria bacterium]|nr:prepilin-type N-terminal cleavage/methylation domain-containing protein [Gammaproteobacteria bacterium]